MTNVVDIRSQKQFDELIAEHNVVLKFWADWCGPCKQFAPHFNIVSDQYGHSVIFASVDVDEVPEIAAAYEVRGIPTVLAFSGGSVVGSLKKRTAVSLAGEIDDLFI